MEKSFWLTMKDNHSIYVHSWQPTDKPKAIIQIAHGMVEHIKRYKPFAEFFVNHSIAVYGNDHRGHGQTGVENKQLGLLDTTHGFEKITEDCISLTDWIKDKHPGTPIFLIGHSMGSFVSRRYISLQPEKVQGVILIGTGFEPNAILSSGKILAKTIGLGRGKKANALFLNKITFFGYNKKTKHQTAIDWLCTDKQVIQQYLNDPLCGFVPTNQFFYDLYSGLQSIQLKENAKPIPKNLPLLFLSGLDDPVGNYGKGVKKAVSFYQQIGLTNVSYKLYPNARHELLNEPVNDDVFQYIYNWVKNNI